MQPQHFWYSIISSQNGLCLRQPGVTNALAACKCDAGGTTDSAVTNHQEPEQNQRFFEGHLGPKLFLQCVHKPAIFKEATLYHIISFFWGMRYAHDSVPNKNGWTDWTARTSICQCNTGRAGVMFVYSYDSYRFIPCWLANFTSIRLICWSFRNRILSHCVAWLSGPWLKPRSNQGRVALHNQTHELQPHKSLHILKTVHWPLLQDCTRYWKVAKMFLSESLAFKPIQAQWSC